MAAEESHDETGEAEDPDTPLCNVIFANCSVKRKDAWMRRFARTLSRQVIAENENLAVVAEILEAALAETCASEWEMENLFNIVINDGEKEQMVALLEKLTGRVKDKANSGVGNTTRKSRYGGLSVALTNAGAVAHKAECEPEHIFRITSEQLDPMWQYLKPKPATLRVADDRWWELRLTNRVWKESNDFERYAFVLSRGQAAASSSSHQKNNRDDVAYESFRGSFVWSSVLHGGDVYDDYELTLDWGSGGNTDRHTGEGSNLEVVYRRDVNDFEKLYYVSHTWGRVTTSEMVNIDTMFPPYFEETKVEELDDAAVDELITNSLKRLGRGAQAGVEEHTAWLPGQRVADRTEEGADQVRRDW